MTDIQLPVYLSARYASNGRYAFIPVYLHVRISDYSWSRTSHNLNEPADRRSPAHTPGPVHGSTPAPSPSHLPEHPPKMPSQAHARPSQPPRLTLTVAFRRLRDPGLLRPYLEGHVTALHVGGPEDSILALLLPLRI